MATTISAHFEPTTDNFGRLTLKAQRNVQALPQNLLTVLVFFSVLILALTGLALADSAMFEPHQPGMTYYGGVPLDYD
jgi:hypothetical protein